jgi:hypothetical protein
MIGFLRGFAHLHETNAEAWEERIAENVVKLLEGE